MAIPKKSIVVEITNSCCNKCYSCWLDNKKVFMNAKDLSKALRKIPDIEESVIIFSGGEPLLHPDLKELIIAVNDITNFKPYILTSGSL